MARKKAAPKKEPEEKPYTLGKWRGHTQWKCRFCPWDTLVGEAAMLEHWATRHRPQPERRLIQAYDAGGRPIDV